MIRDVQSSDVDAVRDIYNYYIEHTVVSFEELPVTATEMRNRVQTVTEDFPWIVFVENDTVLGYAYASKWHSRCAYQARLNQPSTWHHQRPCEGSARNCTANCSTDCGSYQFTASLAESPYQTLAALLCTKSSALKKLHTTRRWATKWTVGSMSGIGSLF